MGDLETFHEFEIRWVINKFVNYSHSFKEKLTDDSHQILDFMCNCILKGEYETILQKSLEYYAFPSKSIDLDDVKNFVSSLLDHSHKKKPFKHFYQFKVFVIAISAIQEFVRCNFCGPNHNIPHSYNLISELLPDSSVSNVEASRLLSLDGETIYTNVMHPKLLLISQTLLSYVQHSDYLTMKWWLVRVMFYHQRILPERNEELHKKLVSLIDEVYHMDWLQDEKHVTQKLNFVMESFHIFLFYENIKLAKQYITEAQMITGLEIELSGAFGKRTHHQQKPVAQLYVKLKRNHQHFIGCIPQHNKYSPADLQLQDDTLLNKILFIDNDEHLLDNLFAEEQAVLLGYCCLVQKSGSFDELLQEEILSYISCLLSQPQVWPVYVKALVMRCKTEKISSRRVERAVTQMEEIIGSIQKSTPPLVERLNLFYSVAFPGYWQMEKELADLLLSIGCTKSALEIYERLQLWEDIVECYIRLGRTSCAEKLIHEQLAKGETPFLWCLLGDVSDNPEHFLKAWELSKHKSARAQRLLGYYYYRKKEFNKSIPPFLTSLEINHLQPQVWFSVGHAATQTEKFELAAKAYRQVVMFDEDQFQAWNNLANAYLKTKQKVRAWRSLNEALKCNYEEWRVWENFLLVSTDIKAFEDALKSWHRLFDIKGKHDDSLLLDILVNAIIKDLPDINDLPSGRLKQRTLELFGRITSVITNDPQVWELYSALTHSINDDSQEDNLEKVIRYLQNALRCYNKKEQWERNYSTRKDALLCAVKLADFSLTYIPMLEGVLKDKQKDAVKYPLQTVIKTASENLSDFPEPEKEELNDLLYSVHNSITKILSL